MYQGAIPSMIDVGPITPWELFKTLCMGTALVGFNDILFKAKGGTFEFIQVYFNEKICLADKKYAEVKSWKEKNNKRNLEKQGYPVTAYSYIFPPSGIRPPPERASVDKLVRWSASVIQRLFSLYWLNLHRHR